VKNKQKAWRLGAAVLRHLFIGHNRVERSYPAARVAKALATSLGTDIRGGFNRALPTNRNVPSGYVAPRRRSFGKPIFGPVEGVGLYSTYAFELTGQPQEITQ
jgi:hypothetical protein